MVCLNSETYCAYNENSDTFKLAVKGSNRNISDALEKYKSVVQTKKHYEGINRGFRLTVNQIKTYQQIKNSITYFYCKRLVLSDRNSTKLLNLFKKFQFYIYMVFIFR